MNLVLIALIIAAVSVFKIWMAHRTRVRIAEIREETNVMLAEHNQRSLEITEALLKKLGNA